MEQRSVIECDAGHPEPHAGARAGVAGGA